MDYRKIKIETCSADEDTVCSVLYGAGVESMEIEDNAAPGEAENFGLFGEVLPDPVEDDGSATVVFYLEDTGEAEDLLSNVRDALSSCAEEGLISRYELKEETEKDRDWENCWKDSYHAFSVGDVTIVPTWEEAPAEDGKVVLRLDPGEAFGTGLHESTQLAMQVMSTYLAPGLRMLDIGSGSGILGMIALKKGADSICAVDIDPHAVEAAKENLPANGLDPERYRSILGDLTHDKNVRDEIGKCYGLVTANLIAEILVDMMPYLPAFVADGGHLVCSGILTSKEESVLEAGVKAGFAVCGTEHKGDWSCIDFSYHPSM